MSPCVSPSCARAPSRIYAQLATPTCPRALQAEACSSPGEHMVPCNLTRGSTAMHPRKEAKTSNPTSAWKNELKFPRASLMSWAQSRRIPGRLSKTPSTPRFGAAQRCPRLLQARNSFRRVRCAREDFYYGKRLPDLVGCFSCFWRSQVAFPLFGGSRISVWDFGLFGGSRLVLFYPRKFSRNLRGLCPS